MRLVFFLSLFCCLSGCVMTSDNYEHNLDRELKNPTSTDREREETQKLKDEYENKVGDRIRVPID